MLTLLKMETGVGRILINFRDWVSGQSTIIRVAERTGHGTHEDSFHSLVYSLSWLGYITLFPSAVLPTVTFNKSEPFELHSSSPVLGTLEDYFQKEEARNGRWATFLLRISIPTRLVLT